MIRVEIRRDAFAPLAGVAARLVRYAWVALSIRLARYATHNRLTNTFIRG
jgi:hypothetical protein